MKRHLILFLALLVATCVRSNEVTPTVSRTPVSLSPTLTAVAEEGERWAIYSPDPKHLWNRMFRQFFKRSTTDGTEYGWDSLDPPPLVASIQLRHFQTSRAQFFYQFQVIRPLLFGGVAGGFQPVNKVIMIFQSHGDVFQFDCANQPGCMPEVRIPRLCLGCHVDEGQDISGINSILSYARKRFPLPDNERPTLFETTPEGEAKNVIVWKTMDQTWKALKTFWQQASP
jgi:hypothetical protein